MDNTLPPTIIKWNKQFAGPKSKNLIDFYCSMYLYENSYRVCFSCNKQKYYFMLNVSNSSEEEYKKLAEDYFITNRDSDHLETAKCIRCGKWDVISGVYCERCKKAIQSYAISSSNEMSFYEEEL